MPENTDVQRIVRELIGQEPTSICLMDFFGHNSRTYHVILAAGREVIVRTHARPETFTTTERNLRVLAELGLPVPHVLAVDLTRARFPFGYMVLNCIPGRDLGFELGSMTRPKMSRLAARLVGYQKSVAALPVGHGYGYVGIGEAGPVESWREFISLNLDQYPITDEHSRRRHENVSNLILEYREYLGSVPATCFMDDITVKNVIIRDGELQGLVDFDCVCYGDPLWWIGLTASGVVSDVGTDQLFYIDELCRLYGLTDVERKIVPLYSAMHAIGFVSRWDGRDGPEWCERMERQIDSWLRQASSVK
jgi:aminoglycoside phosphotransferase (APT) family kinase protein